MHSFLPRIINVQYIAVHGLELHDYRQYIARKAVRVRIQEP